MNFDNKKNVSVNNVSYVANLNKTQDSKCASPTTLNQFLHVPRSLWRYPGRNIVITAVRIVVILPNAFLRPQNCGGRTSYRRAEVLNGASLLWVIDTDECAYQVQDRAHVHRKEIVDGNVYSLSLWGYLSSWQGPGVSYCKFTLRIFISLPMRRIISRQHDTRWELSHNLREALSGEHQFIIASIREYDKQAA